MTVIAADIGGTHARLALVKDNGTIDSPEHFLVSSFQDFPAVLTEYCRKIGVENKGTLLIATAAQPDSDQIWHFHNDNGWVVDRQALCKFGWDTALLVNDFYAAAQGAVILPDDKKTILKKGEPKQKLSRALLGPGTGLGLAYMIPLSEDRWHIQETFGGHMLATSLTEEQALFMRLVQKMHGDQHVVVPEDLVSGRALPALYQAVCLHNGQDPLYDTAKAMLENSGSQNVRHALRLFHEFLGLFSHQVLVTGHAFGGLYFDGGIVQRLRDRDLFDFKTIEKSMILNVTPVVKKALETTPIYAVDDPYIALRGLVEMADHA